MGLTSYRAFQALLKAGYHPPQMGFKCKAGDITEFSYRVKLVRSFQGLSLINYKEETIIGYNAYTLIFLTHSALERFIEINGFKGEAALAPLLVSYRPEIIVSELIENDPKHRFYNFLSDRLNPKLKLKLEQIYDGKETNIAYLSASIRHIFAHGYLTAHANGVNPKKVFQVCKHLSEFEIHFMDTEFTKKIEAYQLRLKNESSK